MYQSNFGIGHSHLTNWGQAGIRLNNKLSTSSLRRQERGKEAPKMTGALEQDHIRLRQLLRERIEYLRTVTCDDTHLREVEPLVDLYSSLDSFRDAFPCRIKRLAWLSRLDNSFRSEDEKNWQEHLAVQRAEDLITQLGPFNPANTASTTWEDSVSLESAATPRRPK